MSDPDLPLKIICIAFPLVICGMGLFFVFKVLPAVENPAATIIVRLADLSDFGVATSIRDAMRHLRRDHDRGHLSDRQMEAYSLVMAGLQRQYDLALGEEEAERARV